MKGEKTGNNNNNRRNSINMVRLWEERERERDAYPRPITVDTQGILRQVGLLKFYEEATSLKYHSVYLRHLVHKWNAHQKAF